MNSIELEYARKRKGRTKGEMAQVIQKSEVSYNKKERGEVAFSDDEKLALTAELDLTYEQFNTIFFDGNLPFR